MRQEQGEKLALGRDVQLVVEAPAMVLHGATADAQLSRNLLCRITRENQFDNTSLTRCQAMGRDEAVHAARIVRLNWRGIPPRLNHANCSIGCNREIGAQFLCMDNHVVREFDQSRLLFFQRPHGAIQLWVPPLCTAPLAAREDPPSVAVQDQNSTRNFPRQRAGNIVVRIQKQPVEVNFVKACDRGIEQVHVFDVGSVEIIRGPVYEYRDACTPRRRQENRDFVVYMCLTINDIEILVLIRVVTENRPDGHDTTMTMLPPVVIEWIQPIIPGEIEIYGFR